MFIGKTLTWNWNDCSHDSAWKCINKSSALFINMIQKYKSKCRLDVCQHCDLVDVIDLKKVSRLGVDQYSNVEGVM